MVKLVHTDYLAVAIATFKKFIENKISDPSGEVPEFNVRVVWSCKTLQNWKALMITDLPDGNYYELTYNGDKKQTYIDSYQKMDNIAVDDEIETVV